MSVKDQITEYGMDKGNLMRIRAMMTLFGLNIAMVAKAGGVSRPMLSMALAGKVRLNPQFYRVLEGNLGKLVEGRQGQVFSVPVTQADEAIQSLVAVDSVKAA